MAPEVYWYLFLKKDFIEEDVKTLVKMYHEPETEARSLGKNLGTN
jgi:hypothetical protein